MSIRKIGYQCQGCGALIQLWNVPIDSKESFDRDIQTKRDENWTAMVSHAEGIDDSGCGHTQGVHADDLRLID